MKKYLLVIIPALALFLGGCAKDDGYSLDKFWVSYGTVESVQTGGNQLVILRDDGARLAVVANMIPQFPMAVDDRIIVNYTILADLPGADGNPAYSIRLNTAVRMLSKGNIKESFILEDEAHRNDSIGNDPVEVLFAWFGGNYLNIRFGIKRQDPSIVHYISLVHDDTNPDTETAHVTLRHNAHGDNPASTAFGYVSFSIDDLVPAERSEINVRLNWQGYDGQDRSDEGIFRLRFSSQEETLTGIQSDNIYDYTLVE